MSQDRNNLLTGQGITASPVPIGSRFRWVVCALLFFATTINYVDRQILSLLKPMLDGQFHWTNTQFGAINSVFQGCYAISVVFFGWFVDRFGTKLGYAVSIAGWSLAALGHGLVTSVGGFFVARAALGLSEGGNFPAAIKATAQWFPKKERALATSLFNSGANIGAIIGPALIPLIASTLGWHSAFVLAGIAGFLWLFAWIPLFDVPTRSRRVSAAELAHINSDTPISQLESKQRVAASQRVLRSRQAWSFIVAKLLTDPVWWFLLIWLPDFFKQSRHLDIKGSGPLLVSIYGIVTVLSIAGGWLSGHLAERGWSITAARKTSLFLFALCVIPIVLVTRVGMWPAVGLLGLAGAAHQAWSATLYTTVSDMFPKSSVATVIGFGTMAGSIGGMIFPIVTGQILDHFGAAGYSIVFGFCSLAYVIAFGLNHVLAPSFEPIQSDL